MSSRHCDDQIIMCDNPIVMKVVSPLFVRLWSFSLVIEEIYYMSVIKAPLYADNETNRLLDTLRLPYVPLANDGKYLQHS